MIRRARTLPPDSLELLLDTLCNTFGGILFIAILVVLLLQMSRPKDENEGDSNDRSVTRVEDDLESELNELTSTVASQKRMLDSLRRDEWNSQNDILRKLTSVKHDSEKVVRDLLIKIPELDAEKHAIKEGLANSKKRLENIEIELSKVRAERRRSENQSQRQTEMPVSRNVNSNPVAVVLRYGRMYVWHHYVNGERAGLNADDFVVVKETTAGLITRPKVTSGVDLSNLEEASTAIRSRLAEFDRDHYYLDVAVREDSFDEFASFRRIVSRLGYSYSVYPMSDGDVIIDRGGPKRKVQ